ncbi:cupin domain-containing protein [Ralstonia pseudosolanacearum]
MPTQDVFSIDTNHAAWQSLPIPELDASILTKPLFADGPAGMTISKVRYPAGFINKSHWHNCAHGMYVLDGVLVTSAGAFGPGSFVWFPERSVMFHGAQADNDVTFLFITDTAFDVHYTHEEEAPPAAL